MNYNTPYPVYPHLNINELKNYENIIILLIDGMGYEFIKKYGKGTFFQKHLQDRLTSIFPSTTAAAITAYSTGLATKQHALTGWFVYFREVATAAVGLPFTARAATTELPIPANLLLNFYNLYDNINRTSYYIAPTSIKDTSVSKILTGTAKRFGYNTLKGFRSQILKALKQENFRKYIYAYWPVFDKKCHLHGVKSAKTQQHFYELDLFVQNLARKLQNTNSLLIITSDHGMLDIKPQNTFYMKDHPKLAETLIMPLSGEPRIPYCYVKATRHDDFLEYMNKNLSQFFQVRKSSELVKENFFGIGYKNEKLEDRIGDYTLLPKGDYVFRDGVLNEKIHDFIGYHAGTSAKEMYIPLIMKKFV